MDGHQVTSLRLAFTGDIIPIRPNSPLPDGMASLCAILEDADFSLGNFEIALVEGGAPTEKLLNIKGDPALAADLPAMGLDAVTLANNHVPDYGVDGIRQTRALVEAQGVPAMGFGETLDEARALHVKEIDGRTVGVIACTCLTPTGMTAAETRAGLSPLRIHTGYEIDPWYQMEEPGDPSVVRIRTRPFDDDLAAMQAAIRAARTTCDIVIVTIHWGFGSGDDLAEYQEPLARALIDAGADVIHGHHPHAIHPVAFYKGRPILFGLGTFIGQQVFLDAPQQVLDMWAEMSPDGMLAEIMVDAAGTYAVTLHPHRFDVDRLARPADPVEAREIAERLAHLSAPFGTFVEFREDGTLTASHQPSRPGSSAVA
ncbi:MAG: CapA family protein [Maritimibacter sp.]|uniref:CapA family protein n=1 Tax=Maritimibacter sp. TaxID=2003363 RepID=UPI001DCFAD61|nr:CapA family protein [Maritimibacter sp.]MBL6425923.1 CapA family protein [Maritimibacter sp.]